jgi:hypothetical protein
MLGRGDGTFRPAVHYYFPRGNFRGATAADLDRDGDLDLVLVNTNGANVLLNTAWSPGNPKPRLPRPGDANGDGRVDQLDLVLVLQAGKYLTDEPATFAEGDWNGDGLFDQRDIVLLLQMDQDFAASS